KGESLCLVVLAPHEGYVRQVYFTLPGLGRVAQLLAHLDRLLAGALGIVQMTLDYVQRGEIVECEGVFCPR
ncbi:MAG: hypothetical protein WCC37_13420, partial [Candidatus Sulfotelmatobacter sp.]